MKNAVSAFSRDEKKKLLEEWKESGLSLPQWRKENAEKYNLPHLSTLYAWCKSLGYSTAPNESNGAEETPKPPDKPEDSEDSGELGDQIGPGQTGGMTEDKEDEDQEENEVIARDRIMNLESSTAPALSKTSKAKTKQEPEDRSSGGGVSKGILMIVGGAIILSAGGFILFKLVKRKPKDEKPNTNQGGNPFDGGYRYHTIDGAI